MAEAYLVRLLLEARQKKLLHWPYGQATAWVYVGLRTPPTKLCQLNSLTSLLPEG